jgi:hypothetical protein
MWRLQQIRKAFCAVIGKIFCLLGIQICLLGIQIWRLVQALTSI